MTQLLIQGSTILSDYFLELEDQFICYTPEGKADAVYPKHVIEGWQTVETSVPNGFTPTAYTWNGHSVEPKQAPAPVVEVPKEVTMRQARLALLGAGVLSSVAAAINSLPSPQKEIAQIEWEYSQIVERDRPLVQLLAPALNLTSAQLDQLFIQAAKL